MGQTRLNYVMVFNIYKEQLDKLDMSAIANEFISGSEHRLKFFGKFGDENIQDKMRNCMLVEQ